MDNFIFNFSVSCNQYDRNLDVGKTKFLIWIETKGTINDLCRYIKNNFAFCHCYNHLGDTFNNGLKRVDNFKQTNIICFDFDGVRLTANEFFNEMKNTAICPNIVYTTTNNGHFKEGKNELYNNRYRVIYCVDEPIINCELYTEMHQTLKRLISNLICDKNVFNDNTDNNVSHFFAGSTDCEIFVTNNVFSLDSLIKRLGIKNDNAKTFSENEEMKNTQRENKPITPTKKERDGKYITYLIGQKKKSILRRYNIEKEEKKEYYDTVINFFNNFADIEKDDFIQDFYNLDFHVIYNKYHGKYSNIECTPIEFNGKNIVVKTPSEYYELRRPFCDKDGYTKKLRDGERRRKQLFINLKIRKQITPSLTFQNLLFNAVYEMCFYMDNRKDPITKYQIAQTAVNAYFAEYVTDKKIKCSTKKFKVDPIFCSNNGIPKRKGAMVYINQKRDEQRKINLEIFADYYDPKLTDKENFEVMQRNGLTAKSLQTFKKYKDQLGLTKKQNSINDNLSVLSVSDSKTTQSPTNGIKSPYGQNKAPFNPTNNDFQTDENKIENTYNMATIKTNLAHVTNGGQTENKYNFYTLYPKLETAKILNECAINRYYNIVHNLRYMAV